jgi:predicted transcriptional regulator
MAQRRINVTLDKEHATKLAQLAERVHVQEGTLARSLLSQALDDARPDPADITALLDRIPGAFEAAKRGLRDARAGRVIDLEEL